jgi:CRP-like cAMP-binding protein
MIMNENFKKVVSEFIVFNEAEWLLFSESMIIKHYKKGEYFLEEGNLCNHVGFTIKGILGYYYLINGIEHMRGFFFPNDFFSNYNCFLLNNKSTAYIQALEDCSVILIHKDEINMLNDKISTFHKLSQNMLEKIYISLSEKFELFFLKTAEERYFKLISERPKLIQKIPQYMIASYLGITPEGLSRIKKRTS